MDQQQEPQFQTLDIILIDIIGFSRLQNVKQLELLSNFNRLYKKAIGLVSGGEEMIEGFIATGDGFYMLIKEAHSGSGIPFAISLKNMAVKFKREIPYFSGIRIAVHFGALIPFVDVSGRTNYLGDGLNSCERYLHYHVEPGHPFYDDGFLIVSDSAMQAFQGYFSQRPIVKEALGQLGVRFSEPVALVDKHGIQRHGALVRTEKKDIIVLNRKVERKPSISGSEDEELEAARYREKIQEYEERLEDFYHEFSNYKMEQQEVSRAMRSLKKKIAALDSRALAENRLVYGDPERKEAKTQIKELEGRYKELSEKVALLGVREGEIVPLLQNLIKKEEEKLIQRAKSQKKSQEKPSPTQGRQPKE